MKDKETRLRKKMKKKKIEKERKKIGKQIER